MVRWQSAAISFFEVLPYPTPGAFVRLSIQGIYNKGIYKFIILWD